MINVDDFLKPVPKTGVIYVLEKAVQLGYSPEDDTWANLGQGAPETGVLTVDGKVNDKDLDKKITITSISTEYGPVSGRQDLREKIADYYNDMFRQGKSSKYTYRNVCIAGGGRVALSRLVAALGNINLGHFIPDYTAYEELLGVFQNFIPIPISLKKESQYKIPLDRLKDEIVSKGLSALLISNPCNPTGQVLMDDELKQWVNLTNALGCLSIYDEFYSHYIYSDYISGQTKDKPRLISAAEFVDDVNKDPVVIINGMSKNWRSPGWRVGWLLASEDIIQRVSSVGSFLDGGAVHPLQTEAVSMINSDYVYQQAELIQSTFFEKRQYMLAELKSMGFVVDFEPNAAFYIWCDLSQLPEPLRDCQAFFEACLAENVITVPGIFFDVNPGKRRLKQHSRYNNYVRISFGPKLETLRVGIAGIKRAIQRYS
mgnify:CR=1 FL=1